MVHLQKGVKHWLCDHCRHDLDCTVFNCSQHKFKANADLTALMPQGSTRKWDLSFTLTRKIIFLRDNGKCQQCKHDIQGEYHVHHLKHREAKGSDHPSNLILLCPKCHGAMNSSRMEKLLEVERTKQKTDEYWKKFTAPMYVLPTSEEPYECPICGLLYDHPPVKCNHDLEGACKAILEGLA